MSSAGHSAGRLGAGSENRKDQAGGGAGEAEADAGGLGDSLAKGTGEAELAGGGEEGELWSWKKVCRGGAGGVEGRGVGREEAAPGECGLGSLGLPAGGEVLRLGGREGLSLSFWLRYRQGILLGRSGIPLGLGRNLGGIRRQAPEMRRLYLACIST